MKQSFVVIGCGRFGRSVAKTLYSLGQDVLAIDKSLEVVDEIADDVTQSVQADITEEELLRSLGIANYDVAIIGITSNMESSIISTILVKELGVREIICKAKDELQGRILEKVGATRVLYPERDMGEKLANSLASKNIVEFIDLDTSYSIVELFAHRKWVGHTIAELALRSKFGINVIAIKGSGGVNISPAATDRIRQGDILVVLGENHKLSKIDQRIKNFYE